MANDTLYIGTNGHVAAIDPTNGQQLWRTALASGFFSPGRYQDVCVLQHDGRVFASCYGHLFCLDAATGEIQWHNELEGLGHNDVTLAIADKAIQFVATVKRSHSSS